MRVIGEKSARKARNGAFFHAQKRHSRIFFGARHPGLPLRRQKPPNGFLLLKTLFFYILLFDTKIFSRPPRFKTQATAHWALAILRGLLMLTMRGAQCAKRPALIPPGVIPEPNIHQGIHHGQSQKESCRDEEACCQKEASREEEEVTESTRCLSFPNSRPVSGRLFSFVHLGACKVECVDPTRWSEKAASLQRVEVNAFHPPHKPATAFQFIQ